MERIDDLAGGWAVKPDKSEPIQAEGSDVIRTKRASGPPPPPPGRKKPASSPPPPPPARKARQTRPPPPPPGRKKAAAAAAQPLPEPRPETHPELGVESGSLVAVAGVIVASDPRPEEPTVHTPPGSGEFPSERGRKVGNTTGTLRVLPTLPRRKGILGDMMYVYTAAFGVAGSRRELTVVERKLATEKKERERRLIEIARAAVADNEMESKTLLIGRDELLDLEDGRSRRAGAIAAADEEIATLEREREEARARSRRDLDALKREIHAIDEKLEPMERKAQVARRKASRLRETLGSLDRRIERQEASLPGQAARDRGAEVESDIASMRAEREEVAREEPVIAAELDNLEPAIASLASARTDAQTRAAKMEAEEAAAVVRTAEKVTAVRARKAVEERAKGELERAQEEALRGLGERLNVERPRDLLLRLAPIEELEVAIGTLERRRVELGELVAGVDRWAFARGLLFIAMILGGIALGVLLFLLRG